MSEGNAAPKETPGMKISDKVMIEMKGVNKWFGDFHVLKDIDLTVKEGERIVIAGPSGSGKSTLIRCINRLEPHDEGSIVIDGIELTEDLKRIDEVSDAKSAWCSSQFNRFPAT